MKANASAAEADATIYPELANANLLRMRGDLKGAENALLSVLRRFPNNASAHEMLGDVAVEKKDLQHAVEWYELALDLAPDSTVLQDKLKAARSRQSTQETDDTASQIGLPVEKPKTPIYVLTFIIGVLIVGSIAYVLGTKTGEKQKPTVPIVRTSDSAPDGQLNTTPTTQTPTSENPPTAPTTTASPSGPQDDKALQDLLVRASADGSRIISLTQDPRVNSIVVTFTAQGSESVRPVAARLAKLAVQQLPEVQMVTVRASQDGKLTYVADVSRARVVETDAPGWGTEHPNAPDAWIDHILANEWNRPGQPAANSGSAVPTTATTAGTTAGGQ